MKPLTIWTIIWFAILLAYCLFCHEIKAALWILELPLFGAIVLGGLALGILWLVTAFRNRSRPRARLTSVLWAIACSAAVYAVVFTPYPHLLGAYFKLYRNVDRYEAVVARVEATLPYPIEKTEQEPDFTVDKGPPVRVAFPWYGLTDNWCGVVYDPTGQVLKAQQFKSDWSNWNDPALRDVKRLFGGDLRTARRLWKDWYFCSFT